MVIESSESYNYHSSYTADKAHDEDIDTFYSVKDNQLAGNFLKLYLSQAEGIGAVILISRKDEWYVERMVDTEVKVYLGDNEVASCGTITAGIEFYISGIEF